MPHDISTAADSSTAATSNRDSRESELDALATVPTVFAPGEGKLSRQALRELSPQDVVGPQGTAGSLSNALIMMVDDESLNIDMTQAFLVEAGYRHFVSTDQPEHAIDMMRRHLPGVLLLDLSMPKVSGLDILEAVRRDPGIRHVPVIVLTSSTDPQTKLKALSLGAMDFLSKPVDPSELALRLRNTLAASAYREYLTQHDPLTGLPNKQRYRQDVAEALAEVRESGGTGALLHLGVDALGRVNDALGRASGDQLLQRIAKRLASCVQTEAGGELSSQRRNPTLYRFDGDEFAVLVPHMEGVPSAAAFISKLLEDAAVSFQRRGSPELFVTSSIGVAVFPTDGVDADLLMRNAGLALRHAKQAGPHRYEFFTPRFTELAQNRLDLGAELRHAISRDEVELRYEPRVELATGRVVAAQSVLRWNHSSGRTVQGEELMDLARGAEMDVAMVEWTLEQVRGHLKGWRAAGLQPVPIAVGVSLANLPAADLGRLVASAVSAGMDARHLTLDLQHVGAVGHLTDKDFAALAGLRKSGVRLCVDRFGAGSSITHLGRIPCEEVKVDASFSQDLERDGRAQAMMLGIGDLAGRLKLACVACAVDTTARLKFLRKHGWHQGQGRLFGEPATGVEFAARWLTGQRSALRATFGE